MPKDAATFTCAACGKDFKAAWSDEEAWSETRRIFGDNPGPCFVVCDRCWEPVAKKEGWA